ncbi:MAG: hypothetical protein JO090_06285 [Rhizobacter sp.]|nr:hypothetical protein [Rhizobacter sp.]
MRRTWVSWLLPLLMLFAQQGAYLHELSHYRPQTEQNSNGKQMADRLCETCLSYAQLAGLASAPETAVALLGLRQQLADAVSYAARPGAAPCARSRGPPVFL